jgi:hypothetical protein
VLAARREDTLLGIKHKTRFSNAWTTAQTTMAAQPAADAAEDGPLVQNDCAPRLKDNFHTEPQSHRGVSLQRFLEFVSTGSSPWLCDSA